MPRRKEFDPEEALSKAMLVFWEQGYEKTSMQDLVERMGVHKRSMYDTFGDKHALFIAALERYAGAADAWQRDVVARSDSPRAALRALLEIVLPDPATRPPGCLVVNCATELAAHDPEAASRVRRSFAVSQQVLEEVVRRGQQAGEIRAHADPVILAMQLHNAWLGLRVQARAGVDRVQLRKLIDAALALLD